MLSLEVDDFEITMINMFGKIEKKLDKIDESITIVPDNYL